MSRFRSLKAAVVIAIPTLPACEREIVRKETHTDPALLRFAEVPSRFSPESFAGRLEKVQKGWTEQQVRDLAGPPDKLTRDSLFYLWSEMGSFGGMFRYYSFKLEDGVVTDIRTGGGCRIVEPLQ